MRSEIGLLPGGGGVACLTPLRGLLMFRARTHGLRRGLDSFAASRLRAALSSTFFSRHLTHILQDDLTAAVVFICR